jgi:large subunit ribosomal protein L10
MLRERKETLVAELTEEFRSSTSLLVADPRGLSVASLRDLRNSLRAQNARFRVTKNTLARIAAKEAGQDALIEFLTGPTGVAVVEGDPAPVAKALSDWARTARQLELRGGVLDGRPIDAAGIQRLATLPPREQLYAQVVGGIAAPLQGLVNTIAAIPRGLVVALDQIRQQKEGAAA